MPVTVPVIVAIAHPVLHPVLQVLDMWLNDRRCYQRHCICQESHAISVWVMVAVLLQRVALVLISIWVGMDKMAEKGRLGDALGGEDILGGTLGRQGRLGG